MQAFENLPPAPDHVLQSAEKVVREHFGNEFMQKYVTRHSSQAYPAPRAVQLAKYSVVYEVRVQGPDYSRQASVFLFFDDNAHLVEAVGLVNCNKQHDACPPFKFARSTAIEVARGAGVDPGFAQPVCNEEDLVGNLCARLQAHPEYDRFVWRVDNKLLNWQFWDTDFWECKERGRTAVVDAATGKLLWSGPWCRTG